MRQLSYVLVVIVSMAGVPARAATLPDGFSETLVAGGLSAPTAMQFAPDGRLFVCEQNGTLRVIKNGVLLPTPFVTLSNVNSAGERGLLGVAFDPNFSVNHFVYVYYTTTSPTLHNRISRLTANGDVAVPGSEVAIFDLPNLSATNHNGGALAFAGDGKLYVGVGENNVPSNAQSLATPLGKMLRINSDGSIPSDNPFYNVTTGNSRAIWALGLRNPFTFAFHPNGTTMYINDVGAATWEEINVGGAGFNYGWPNTEGPTTAYNGPIWAYTHSNGCAIAGGAFYAPATALFPPDYTNDYFFADLCGGWIQKLDSVTGLAESFATGISLPVDLKVASDGSLYYLARGSGAVYRISAQPPLPGTDYRLFWHHSGTGALAAWNMDGTGLVSGQAVTPSPVNTSWKIVGSGDFNGDGQLDLFWQNQVTRLMTVWLMNGTAFAASGLLSHNTVSDTNWAISTIADMNGDGHPDLIWQHRVDGWLVVWFMNGTTLIGSSFLSPNRVTDINWRIVGAADFDGDGDNDLLWQHSGTGLMAVWLMNGVTFVAPGVISNNTVSDTNWKIKAVVDVDGDGNVDFIWHHQVSGLLAVWFMDGTTFLSGRLLYPSRVADVGWQVVAAR
jgi:glucose/arabinose dehydrogenase